MRIHLLILRRRTQDKLETPATTQGYEGEDLGPWISSSHVPALFFNRLDVRRYKCGRALEGNLNA
jgi:hypothetical protein